MTKDLGLDPAINEIGRAWQERVASTLWWMSVPAPGRSGLEKKMFGIYPETPAMVRPCYAPHGPAGGLAGGRRKNRPNFPCRRPRRKERTGRLSHGGYF